MNFVVALTPDRDGKAPDFTTVASNFNAKVSQLGPFGLEETLPGIDAGLDFNRAAFELTEGEDTHFSNPVDGKEGVYVLSLVAREAPRVPTFEEVEKDVMPKAYDHALADALSRKASEVRDTLDKAMQSGQSFREALVAFGLEPEKTLEFTSSTEMEDVPYAEVLMRGVMLSNRGDLSELLPARDAVLLAYTADRIAGDPASFGSIKGQLVNTIRRQYGRTTFDAWQEDLLKQANFQDRQAPVSEEEPVEDESAAEPAS